MKIFDHFYSQRSLNYSENNSGLGLAISKNIDEAHDSSSWAEVVHTSLADVKSEPLGIRFFAGLQV